jgi:nitrite reductase (NADH) small subunit
MNAETSRTICLTKVDEIPEGQGREFRVGDQFIAIFRVNGQFYALEDMCPHAGAPLNDGPLQNGTVTCLWHGWRFNLHDGACLNVPRGRPVATYAVTIQGQDLYVTLPGQSAET